MDNFVKINSKADTESLLHLLALNPKAWGDITVRQNQEGSPHHDTECIVLRGPLELTQASMQESIAVKDYPRMQTFLHGASKVVFPLLDTLAPKELGRVMIVKLNPGGHIDEHTDEGLYARSYVRYHVVLSSEGGNLFHCGQDCIHMEPKSVWWFNHQKPHSVDNHSTSPRVHLVIDMMF